LRIKSELAGKRVKCPLCQAIVIVPAGHLETEFEIVDKVETEFEIVDDVESKSEVVDDGPQPALPVKKIRFKRKQPTFAEIVWKYRGVVYGCGMMIFALVWFAVAWFLLNAYWIFAPVLFILGIARAIYSLAGRKDEDEDWGW